MGMDHIRNDFLAGTHGAVVSTCKPVFVLNSTLHGGHSDPLNFQYALHQPVVHTSVVVETVSETSHLCWNNETIRFKSSLTSIIIESTYLTLNMNKIWGCFKVQVGWQNAFYGETGSRKGLEKVSARPGPWKNIFNLHFKCQQNNTLPVFNVQIIRLYSLGSWNVYVSDNFQT